MGRNKDRKLQTLIEVCTDFASIGQPTTVHRPVEQVFAMEEEEDPEDMVAMVEQHHTTTHLVKMCCCGYSKQHPQHHTTTHFAKMCCCGSINQFSINLFQESTSTLCYNFIVYNSNFKINIQSPRIPIITRSCTPLFNFISQLYNKK